MKVGLQINSFTWPGGPEAIGPTVAAIARTADDAGFDSLWVMDHFFQIRSLGQVTEPMLEGQTTLGFMAAHTSRVRLGLLVGGIHYRPPGLWVKMATTLDVLSGGRAWLGIGAAWNQDESRSLGFPFPPLVERFEWLEDTLRLAHEMGQGERGSERSVDGHHLHAARALNAPRSISRPRVPIMLGGGGERRTLRLAARYADATNVFGGPEAIAHKYRVLREHCAAIGRRYDDIERSTLQDVALVEPRPGRPATTGAIVDRLGELSDAGAQHVILSYPGIGSPANLERIGREVIPQVRPL